MLTPKSKKDDRTTQAGESNVFVPIEALESVGYAKIKAATPDEVFVDAKVVAQRYSVSPRYVLLLADQGRIPCLRLGKKATRFSLSAVAAALEAGIQGE